MAEQQDMATSVRRLGFKTVQLMKDQTLGIGSYGKVCKAKCDELVCVAKLIHETLFDPISRHQGREHRLPIKRFEQECEFLSAISHPNIIQYLGVYHDPDSHLPALLMELMDDNLTHYLESFTQPIPYHVQVNICHDITLALSFLHSNGIIHRDLSGNNVLLFGNIRAKVTDFGMAKLDGLNPRATTRPTYTTCPGSDVYMAPETIKVKPVYNETVDCFSFGVIVIQVLTGKFPEPGDRQKEIHVDHPGVQAGILEVRVSEVERRQNHISIIDQNNHLLPIALDCLKDRKDERPSAQELSKRLAALKEENPECNLSMRVAQTVGQPEQAQGINGSEEKDRQIKRLQEQLQLQTQRKDHITETSQREIQHMRQQLQQAEQLAQEQLEVQEQRRNQEIEAKDEEIRRLRQQLQRAEEHTREVNQLIEEKDQASRERETQLGDVSHQLEISEQEKLGIERRFRELEQLLSQSRILHRKPSPAKKSTFQLSWSDGESAPRKMYRECNVITDSSSVYFQVNSDEVHTYNIISHRWSQLPSCRYQGSSLAVVNNMLTAIGGEDVYVTGYRSLFSLENLKQWKEILPPMQVARTHSIAICTGTALIIAGGWNETSVEVMNTETRTWSNAPTYPNHCTMPRQLSAAIASSSWEDMGPLTKE